MDNLNNQLSGRSDQPQSLLVPTVIEQEDRGYRVYDIYSRLLKDRIIFLGSDIDSQVANLVVAQMLFLEQQAVDEDIYLYINSRGGSVDAGLAIYDTMNYVRSDVRTICVGAAASMAAVLLANGAPKKRSVLPNARVMIHQPLIHGLSGQVTDIEISTQQLQELRKKINQILAARTGQPIKKISQDVDRDFWMTAPAAVKYGLVDSILDKRP